MTIKFTPMDEETFNEYVDTKQEEYAAEHVKAGNWSEEEAVDKAKEQFAALLPDGVQTKEQHLYTILKDEEPIGILWLKVHLTPQGKQAFIFDIEIESSHRGKGLGKATMEKLDEYARQQDIQKIGLHVFAHNSRAIELYKKTGFEMTGHNMVKRYK